MAGNKRHDRLTQKDLAVANDRSVDEVLRGMPGIGISKAGAFGVGVLQLRGVGGQGLMTLDGMPIPDVTPGVVNLNALLPDGLGSVEINRGFAPASQPFSALGGSIRMTSRDAVRNGAGMRVEGGTFGFLQETLRGDWLGTFGRAAVTVNRTDAFDGAHNADERQGNPERGIGGDLGFEWRPSDHIALSLTGFYSRFNELLVLFWSPQPTAAIPCYGTCLSNIPQATIAGFEAAGEWTVNAQWRGGAAYTYTDNRNLENGARLPYRSYDNARLWVE